jgi:N-dimethylarginine dimethylaminohydrolase
MNRSFGGHSMTAPLKRVIVKHPREAYRNNETIAAQWKSLGFTAPPDLNRAVEEFEYFASLIESSGAEILYLPADDRTGLDSIYAHDPALVTDAGVILFQPGKKARQGEGPALRDALKKWDIPVLGTVDGPAFAEGGDMLWADIRTLLVGRSFRTNSAGIEALRSLLSPLGVAVLEFHLPCWKGPENILHLMSFISLLDSDLAVVYRRLVPVPLLEFLLERKFQLIDIPEAEFPTQGCNVLALSPRNVLILKGNPVTKARLEEEGCTVREFEGQEIGLKGSGGPTCLTRPLLRQG